MAHELQVFPSGPFATNAYVVSEGSHALIIDPAPGSSGPISDYVQQKGLSVEKILITHSHWDHIGDCAAVAREYGAPVYVHRLDAKNLEDPGSDHVPLMLEIEAVKPEHFLEDGQTISVGSLELEVMHTPGHCPGLVCLYCQGENFLISGDLLFRGAIGQLALPTAEPERMWKSLARVAALPPETVVHPGHGESTTIGEESWLPRAKEIFGGQ